MKGKMNGGGVNPAKVAKKAVKFAEKATKAVAKADKKLDKRMTSGKSSPMENAFYLKTKTK